MDQSDIHQMQLILRNMIAEVAPDELPTFDRVGSSLIARLARGSGGQRVRTRGLPVPADVGLMSLHIIVGTLAVLELWRKGKEFRERLEFEREVQHEWEKALIAAGMKAEYARRLPAKYCPELIRFITAQRLGSPNEDAKGQID